MNVIFDWSGTLSDDLYPVYLASLKTLKHFGWTKQMSFDEFKNRLEFPYMGFYDKLIPGHTKDEINLIYTKAIHEVDDPKPFKGTEELLEKLKSKNAKIILFSSHPQSKLIDEVEKYGFEKYFDGIEGGVHDKVEEIEHNIKKYNLDPKETYYVGDSPHDMHAAKEGGVISIAVPWGYFSEADLKGAKPDHLPNDFKELAKIFS
ncbi:MAG: HAD family hydrolase [Candidatus Altiarchaeota archaeon]|nr:HAD family hydrolase [Candidatus Altiarchaeota archaeon]